jgi:hypothetical protein
MVLQIAVIGVELVSAFHSNITYSRTTAHIALKIIDLSCVTQKKTALQLALTVKVNVSQTHKTFVLLLAPITAVPLCASISVPLSRDFVRRQRPTTC